MGQTMWFFWEKEKSYIRIVYIASTTWIDSRLNTTHKVCIWGAWYETLQRWLDNTGSHQLNQGVPKSHIWHQFWRHLWIFTVNVTTKDEAKNCENSCFCSEGTFTKPHLSICPSQPSSQQTGRGGILMSMGGRVDLFHPIWKEKNNCFKQVVLFWKCLIYLY